MITLTSIKKCEIKTRTQFREEFNDELEDNQMKTVLVAVYHPVMTNSKIGFSKDHRLWNPNTA